MLTGRGLKIAIGLAIFTVCLVIGGAWASGVFHDLHMPNEQDISHWIEGYGEAGPVLYLLFYAVAPTLMIPSFPITMAAGVLFGTTWGIVFASLGSTLGALLPFVLARSLGRRHVEKRLHGRLKELDQNVEKYGWIYVAITRLIPLFPFEALNFGFGLTKVRFVTYIVVSWLGMLPVTIAYVLFGASIFDIFEGRVGVELVIGVIVVVLLSLLPLVYRRSRYFKPKQSTNSTIDSST